MRLGPAFLSGVIGGAVMALFIIIARASGIRIDPELLLGGLGARMSSALCWTLGLGLHFLISGLAGVAYAVAFEHLAHRAGFRLGILFSLFHTGVVGLALSAVRPLHPVLPGASHDFL